jgi:hypothetical protein
VLDVALGHVLLGEVHVAPFEDLAPEVVDDPLVRGQLRIGARQHLRMVGVGQHRHLRLQRRDEKHQAGGPEEADRMGHGGSGSIVDGH